MIIESYKKKTNHVKMSATVEPSTALCRGVTSSASVRVMT